jgi:hypothetical protein
VGHVLDFLEPKGEIKPPKLTPAPGQDPNDELSATVIKTFATPEARARDTANLILHMLTTNLTAQEREAQRAHLASQGVAPSVWANFYGMPEAAKDLLIEKRVISGKTTPIHLNVIGDSWRPE